MRRGRLFYKGMLIKVLRHYGIACALNDRLDLEISIGKRRFTWSITDVGSDIKSGFNTNFEDLPLLLIDDDKRKIDMVTVQGDPFLFEGWLSSLVARYRLECGDKEFTPQARKRYKYTYIINSRKTSWS